MDCCFVAGKMSVDNYCIVQTYENGDHFLSVLPSKWVVKNGWKDVASTSKNYQQGIDLCYWPKGVSGYRLLEKTKKDPTVKIDKTQLSTHRCKQKRSNFRTYSEVKKNHVNLTIHQANGG